MNKKISVVMPVYNAANYVEFAVESILNQTYKNLEIICIDDCSTDDTYKVLSSFNDNRLHLYQNTTNKGVIYTRSKAYSLCNGDYIANMDADDISYPDRLEKQVVFLEKYPDVNIVGSWINKVDKNLKHIGYWKTAENNDQIKSTMMFKMPLANPTVMFRSLLKEELSHSEEFYSVEDYALYVKLALRGHKFYNIQETLLYYRVLDTSMFHSNIKNEKLKNSSHELVYKELFTNLKMEHLDIKLHRQLISQDIKTKEQLNTVEKHLRDILLNCPSSYCDKKVLSLEISRIWAKTCLKASKNMKINLIDTLYNDLIVFDIKSIKNIVKAALK